MHKRFAEVINTMVTPPPPPPQALMLLSPVLSTFLSSILYVFIMSPNSIQKHTPPQPPSFVSSPICQLISVFYRSDTLLYLHHSQAWPGRPAARNLASRKALGHRRKTINYWLTSTRTATAAGALCLPRPVSYLVSSTVFSVLTLYVCVCIIFVSSQTRDVSSYPQVCKDVGRVAG